MKMFGICNLSIVPCRKEPSDKSEMVTQLLFGEHFEVIDEKNSWVLIRIAYDKYECWIDKKQFLPISETKFRQITEKNTAVTTELVQLAIGENKEIIPVVIGSSLPKFKDKTFELGKQKWFFDGDVIFPHSEKKDEIHSVVEVAQWYLNAPYLWGGRSPFGIDCSGFTQIVFKICGIKLPRDAWQQAKQGETVNFLEEAQPGDLAFFDNEDGKIVHVGILLDNKRIIHSHGKVRIDKLDHYGIYNSEMKKYTHRLRVVKKIC
jgi:cell wall-associated NlpC family hydrolase